MSGKGGKRDDSYFAADRRKRKKNMMIIIPIVVAVAAIVAISALLYKAPAAQAINGVQCNTIEATTYHVHSHLAVLVDGKNQTIPSQIGILTSPNCLYWLHTHDTTGVIHVESPQQKQFVLGQFMDIWQKTVPSSKSFFNSLAGKPLKAYVNGTQFQGDYRNIELTSRQQIVLAFGAPPEEIPTYDFGALK
jgi:hypothetical protein